MKRHLSQLDRSSRSAPCDCCEGVEFSVVSRCDRRGRPLKTVICHACGLLSHERIPDEEELAAYYQREYRLQYNGEETPSARRVIREWHRGAGLVRDLAGRVPSGGRVIEIGSGIGCTVKQFELAGFDATGIEPGAGFQSYSRDVLQARVAELALEQMPTNTKYDLVLLVHVLEHLRSPTAALSRIRTMLDPGNQLYVEVPNIAAPHAAPAKRFHYAHLYNFTSPTLAELGARCEFAVETLSDKRDRNLRVLLTAVQGARTNPRPESAAATLEALDRFNTLTYHLRWSYVADRARTVWRHARQRIGADSQLAQIVQKCRPEGVSDSKVRRAA